MLVMLALVAFVTGSGGGRTQLSPEWEEPTIAWEEPVIQSGPGVYPY